MSRNRSVMSASKAKKSSKSIGKVNYSYCSQPCPDEMRVTLRYAQTNDAIASVGISSQTFALNDVFDPDYTGVGQQPAFYDEWCAIYNRWVVAECDYDVAVTSRTVSGRLSVAAAPTNQSAFIPATFEAASSLRYAKSAETTGGGPTVHIRGTVNMGNLYGVPDYAIESDDSYAGAVSASPARRMLLAVVAETSGSSDALSWTIVLKYRVRFLQPRVAALSLTSRSPAATAAVAPHFSTHTCGGPRQVEPKLSVVEPFPPKSEDGGCRLCQH